MIDKFKPSASVLSETNLFSFINELNIVKQLLDQPDMSVIGLHEEQSFIDWREYIIDANDSKMNQLKTEQCNQLRFDCILKKGKEVSYPFKLETIDRNASGKYSISPRYQTKLYYYGEMSEEEYYTKAIEVYQGLCQSLEEVEKDEKLWLDSFIFDDLAEEIMAPSEYNRRGKNYNWETKTFDEHVLKLKNYYKTYELSDEEVMEIIKRFYENNYPDTPTEIGYMDSLERIYDGKFNPERSKTLIRQFLRSKRNV